MSGRIFSQEIRIGAKPYCVYILRRRGRQLVAFANILFEQKDEAIDYFAEVFGVHPSDVWLEPLFTNQYVELTPYIESNVKTLPRKWE